MRNIDGIRGGALLGAIVVFTLAAGAGPAQRAGAEELAPYGARWAAALDQALSARAFRGAAVSALVVDRESGEALYGRAPDRALIPASTQKVITALAALDAFGPGHRFATTVHAAALPDRDGAVEDLYVTGGGDASLTSEQWWRLAADLRARGLRVVAGDLVLDDTVFDQARWHPSWEPVTARAYHGPVGALTANYGAFRVVIAPARQAGLRARVSLDPPIPYFALENRAETVAGVATQLRVERLPTGDRERVLVSGKLAPGAAPKEIWRSVADPRAYAGAVLRMQLEANGIGVGGAVRVGAAPEASVELLSFEGHPVRQIVGLMLKYSSNMIAEGLVKNVARAEDASRAATWELGVAAVGRRLSARGVSLDGVRIVDGSGLSRENRVSARLLVDVLRAADGAFGIGPDLLAGLPIAGEDGTLEERALGAHARVRAKTGTLEGVATLAGHARTGDGRELVFALLVNGYQGAAGPAVDAVDRFAESLVGSFAN